MYSAMRKRKGLSCRELAEQMKTEFPVMNSAGISLAERPLESGITYTAAAKEMVKEICGYPKKNPNRKDKASVHCWLPEGTKKAFLEAKTKRGFVTDHDYIIFLIMQDIARIEKAACSGGTEQSGVEKCFTNIITEREVLSNDN
jgi:hypothetical protein